MKTSLTRLLPGLLFLGGCASSATLHVPYDQVTAAVDKVCAESYARGYGGVAVDAGPAGRFDADQEPLPTLHPRQSDSDLDFGFNEVRPREKTPGAEKEWLITQSRDSTGMLRPTGTSRIRVKRLTQADTRVYVSVARDEFFYARRDLAKERELLNRIKEALGRDQPRAARDRETLKAKQ